ncbi:MAG: hypothetical protein ABIM30_10215 [candidate division WOR-3 bacterium]
MGKLTLNPSAKKVSKEPKEIVIEKEVIKEIIVEKPVVEIREVVVEKPVIEVKEIIKEVPVKVVETVEKPVYVEVVKEVIKEIPIEKEVEKIVLVKDFELIKQNNKLKLVNRFLIGLVLFLGFLLI